MLLEAGRVRHQVRHGDRLGVRLRDLEVEVGIDVGVEVQLAFFDELHDRRPGEQLAGRPRIEERLVGDHRLTPFPVGEAVALGEDEFAVLDDGDRGAGDVLLAQLFGDELVEECLLLLEHCQGHS